MAFLGKHFMPPFLFLLISLLFLSTHATRSFSRQVRNSNNNPFSTNSKYEAELQQENKEQPSFYPANNNPHGFGATVVKSTPPPPPLPASVDELPVNYDANSYITSSETNQNQQQYQTNSEKDEFLTVAQRYGERDSSPAKVSTKYTNTEDQKEWIPANTKYQQQEYHQTNSKPKTVAERYEKTYSNKEEEQWSPAKTENQQEKYHQTNSKEQTDAEKSYGSTYNPYKFYKKKQNVNEEDKTNNIPTTTTVAERYSGNTNKYYKNQYPEEENLDELDDEDEDNINPNTMPQKYDPESQNDNNNQFYFKDQRTSNKPSPPPPGKQNTDNAKYFFNNEKDLDALLDEQDDDPQEDKETNKPFNTPPTYPKKYNPKQTTNHWGMSDTRLAGTHFNVEKDEFDNNPYTQRNGAQNTYNTYAQQNDANKPNPNQSAFVGDMSNYLNQNDFVKNNDP